MVKPGDRLRRVPQVDESGIRKWADRVRAIHPDAVIILFGSRARGEANIYSDYDFCVVSSGFHGLKPWERVEPLVICWEVDAPVEVIAYTPEEWDDWQDWTFLKTVREEGKAVEVCKEGP